MIVGEACCSPAGVRPRLQGPDEGDLPRARAGFAAPEPRSTPSGGRSTSSTPTIHPLWGIEHGCRTVVIYSPDDLSCYWNQLENQSRAIPGYGRRRRSARTSSTTSPVERCPPTSWPSETWPTSRRTGPDAVPSGSPSSATPATGTSPRWRSPTSPRHAPGQAQVRRRDQPQGDSSRRDPNLVHYPLVYVHGRAAVEFSEEDKRRDPPPPRPPAAAPSSPTPPAGAPPSTPPSAGSSPT